MVKGQGKFRRGYAAGREKGRGEGPSALALGSPAKFCICLAAEYAVHQNDLPSLSRSFT